MAEKQNNDSMVNAQDNDEWVQTKTPVQVPVAPTPVQPPMSPADPVVPVIIVKQGQLPYGTVQPMYVASPDAVIAQQHRYKKREVSILLFASYVIAGFALWNTFALIEIGFVNAAPVKILFTALKMTVGLFGAILLMTKKLTAIKVYAVVFLMVYECYAGFFLYDVYARRGEITPRKCHSWDSACLNRAWSALMWRGFCLCLFSLCGFVVTWLYAIKAEELSLAEEKRAEVSNTDIC